jgi:hypothetical protein
MARAAVLSREERREIARKAVEARWAKHFPQATHEGAIRFGDIQVEVAVLDNGQRVITHGGLLIALGRARTVQGRQHYRRRTDLPAFLRGRNLKPLISEGLVLAGKQIEFRTKLGVKSFGYAADFLLQACEVFVRARATKVLNQSQRKMAGRARIIAKHLQGYEITRLIDEATGFQNVRGNAIGKRTRLIVDDPTRGALIPIQ